MKPVFRLIRRSGVFYSFHTKTGERKSLATKDKQEAAGLLAAKIQAHNQPVLNLKMAQVYLSASDPKALKRTWHDVLDCKTASMKGDSKARWARMDRHEPLSTLWNRVVIRTLPEDLWLCLNSGTVTTNQFLRVLHNFALDMSWIQQPVIPKKQWPKVEYGVKRSITAEEHARIIYRELNPERRAFYELSWYLGASQGDLAKLKASDVTWSENKIAFSRGKSKTSVIFYFGPGAAKILMELPKSGYLFPYMQTLRASDRATEFAQRVDGLKIDGVTLHSYRYGWAERAEQSGYPERFAMKALGHNSKAVARAYAKHSDVVLPSLERYEENARKGIIIAFPNIDLPVMKTSIEQ